MADIRLSAWHMLPIAIGLHGLLLAYPMPKTADKVDNIDLNLDKPIRIVTLPPQQKSLPQAAKPKKIGLTTPKQQVQRPNPIASLVNLAPSPKPSPLVKATPTPAPAPTSTPTAQPTPTASPSPQASPTPTDSEALQVEGATSCNGIEGCYALAESNGREVLKRITQQLEAKGYEVSDLDLEDDTGMSAHKLSKKQQPEEYLYVMWSDKGTTYLKTKMQLSRQELEAKIQQS